MNLLQALQDRLNPSDRHIATIVAQRDRLWVARTIDEATVLLSGDAKIDDVVYYERATHKIVEIAPKVEFSVWEV